MKKTLKIAGITFAVLAGWMLFSSRAEIKRYLRMRAM